jgi:hypothetical protein
MHLLCHEISSIGGVRSPEIHVEIRTVVVRNF